MITCNLEGGLGNQLFKIYTTISCAMKNQNSFFFLNIYELKNAITERHTYWDTFLVSLKPFLKDKNILQNVIFIKETTFTYRPVKIQYDQNVTMKMLIGYFQSPKYFEYYSTIIYRLLKIDSFKIQLTEQYSNLINNDLPVSMHFRLGDYKTLPDYYVILKEDYYKRALKALLEIVQTNKVFVKKVLYFCEDQDIEDVQNIILILQLEFPEIIFERADPALEDWEQLILMSLCRYNIIANSTFSWWGAYLNTYRHKKVIYPNSWFGDKTRETHDTCDLFPEDWIKM
jgi:hypothetical protein